MKKLQKWPTVLFSAVMIAGLVLAILPQPALADSPEPTRGIANKPKLALEKYLVSRTRIQANHSVLFFNANLLTETIQMNIQKYQKMGWDTTELEAALVNYQNALEAANSFHLAADDLIATHAGFDDNGKVVDITQARLTMIDVLVNQNAARNGLKDARKTFKRAINAYLREHES